MSTILDALKRVQHERQPGDLREAVTGGSPPPSRKRRGAGLIYLLLLLMGAGAGAWYVWPGETELRPLIAWWLDDEAGPEAAGEQVALANPPARDRAVPPAVAPPSVRNRANPAPPRVPAARATGSGLSPRADPPSRQTPGAAERQAPMPDAAPPRPAARPSRAAALRQQPTQGTPNVARGEPATPSNRSPARVAPAPQVPVEPPAEPERVVLDTRVHLEPAPRRPRNSSSRGGALQPSTDTTFPLFSIESVRWHPEPDRRAARILLDQTRPVEAREGDIIAGVAIYRIDPGAVEFRFGESRRRIKIGR